MSTIQILAHDNGFGLSRSQRLLADALRQNGHDVVLNGMNDADARLRRTTKLRAQVATQRLMRPLRRSLPRYDINIMLEHVWPAAFGQARQNLYMPNPEWVDRHDLRYLRYFDLVLGKTHDATAIFARLGVRSRYVGWISEDRFDPSIPRESAFFHLAGGALIKGTERLLEVWRRHPQWPKLTVLQDPRRARPGAAAENIEHRTEYLDVNDAAQAAELRRLQNAHRFHVCPSETDTWGHYIGEALSVGAITLTTNAPSMNEMVQPDRGLLIDYSHTGTRALATTYFFDESSLEAMVSKAMTLPTEECLALSDAARDWFTQMQRSFPDRIANALEILPVRR